MSNVNFARFSSEEQDAVDRIVDRVRSADPETDVMELRMDLSATHASCPLRLVEMADADDFNLFHDIRGIQRHIDRRTGELTSCFVPRFAKPEGVPHA